jgi:putative GTP pyrophosphokinase
MAKRRKHSKSNLEQLEAEYRAIAPIAERFCTDLSGQLNKLLENERISLGLPIEYRVKKWESIVDKLERLSLNPDSIKELNDLIGLRLMLLFKRDLLRVCELVSSTLKVLDQYDTLERLKEDQFGYSSIHFIVELPESWLAVPTLAEMRGLKAEMQVRTLAQHIWAAASHSLQYKREESVPPPVRRAIYRVSALLETVDLEFERVLEQRDSYRSDVDILETEDQLNVDLLEKALDSLLPADNKKEDEPYSVLVSELIHFKINTVPKLTTLIKKQLPRVLKEDKNRVQEYREMTTDEIIDAGESPERIVKGVYYTHVGLVRTALKNEFGREYLNYLIARMPKNQ